MAQTKTDIGDGINRVSASPSLRAAVHALITSHMASVLIMDRVPLDNTTARQAALVKAGFGDPSIQALSTRAIQMARDAISQEE